MVFWDVGWSRRGVNVGKGDSVETSGCRGQIVDELESVKVWNSRFDTGCRDKFQVRASLTIMAHFCYTVLVAVFLKQLVRSIQSLEGL